ncbi:MAG: hypothetical protein MJ093_05450 [Saccharofermentans sp.]|nr:hypothetical protein [Saccharofermentans sp.]
MKKKIFAAALALSFIFVSTACASLSDEEEDVAKTNAINYVKEKYGFKAKVEDVEPVIIDGIFPSKGNTAKVSMSYKGDDFLVYVSHQEESSHGKDNYQWPEFTEIIQDEVYDQIDCDDAEIYVSLALADENVMDIDDYYDSCRTEINVLTSDISNTSIENFDASFLGDNYEVSIRDYNNSFKGDFPKEDEFSFVGLYDTEPLYLDSYSIYRPDGNEFVEYATAEFDDFKIIYDKNADVTLTEIDVDYSQFDYSTKYGKDFDYPYSGIHVETSKETRLYFYFSTDLIPDDDDNYIVDIWQVGKQHVSSYGRESDVPIKAPGYYSGHKVIEGSVDLAFVLRSY